MKYNFFEPNYDKDTIFEYNEAPYGTNFASYPVKMILEIGTSSGSKI